MSIVIAVSRILLPLITTYIIVKCLIALLFGRPQQNIIAHLQDSVTGEEYDLNMWESSIGRSKACDVVVNDPTASRFHAVIARRVNGWYIYDLNSKNGISVNGEKIERKSVIEGGDTVTLGESFNLKFIVDNDPIIRVSKRQLKQMQKEAERRRQSMPDPVEQPYVPNPAAFAPAPAPNYTRSFEDVSSTGRTTQPSLVSSFGKIYRLSGFNATIGSDEKCSIRLTDPEAEPFHASVDLYEDGSWVISNLSRRGSTFLNGSRVLEPYILIEGDKIKVAGSVFTYTERV